MRAKHKSLEKEAERSVRWIEGLAGVTKVVIGFSEACRHKYPPGHIRIRGESPGGLKANAYSGKGVTDLFIRIESGAEEKISQSIMQKFTVK